METWYTIVILRKILNCYNKSFGISKKLDELEKVEKEEAEKILRECMQGAYNSVR